MKTRNRWLAGLLSLAMVLSLFAGWPERAHAVQAGGLTGSLTLTVSFDLPQTRAAVEQRNIVLTLSQGGAQVEVPLTRGTATQNSLQAQVAVTAKNISGEALTNETRLGSYEAVISGLQQGTYDLRLTGTDYVSRVPAQVTIDGYSKHIIAGTGDGSFALGDVNGDGALDEQDLAYMDEHLGQTSGNCDLNGDGRVDVTDLTYINNLIGAADEAQCLDTAAIVAPTVEDAGIEFLDGSAGDLFTSTQPVTVAPKATGDELVIPIDLPAPVEMSRIVIETPEGPGSVETVTADVVIVEDGGTERTETFLGSASAAGARSAGTAAGEPVVINLGRKVAVKKVTIKVTRVTGQTGAQPEFAAVTQIEFLKDIVPANPTTDADKVAGLTAQAGSEKVELVWNAVRNVTGYEVAYGTSQSAMNQSVHVVTNRAVVTGLENHTEYFFQVTATSDNGWQGTPSAIVSATPQPSSAPGAPSNLRVEPGDGFLRFSWGKTKDASYYQAFYREAGAAEFIQAGGDLTGTTTIINWLVNGTQYELAVKAGNSAGIGPYSATALGTPQREDLEMPDLPTDDRIDNSAITSIVMVDASNVDRTLCPNFTTGDLIDGDAATYWVAGSFSKNSYITYTFDEPHDMNYFIMVPYLLEPHRSAITRYKIIAKDASGNPLLECTYNAPSLNDKNYMVMPFQMVEGVQSISIGLDQWTGSHACVSVAEIAFYDADRLASDIAALFANDSFSALAAGVTEEQIAALEAQLSEKSSFYLDVDLLRDELALARELLDGGTAQVRTGFQSRSGSKDSQYGQSASDLQPLGVTVAVPAGKNGSKARTPVAIYAELPGDAPVYVVPTQFYGESGIWRGTPIQLQNGRNYVDIAQIGSLKDERGGPLYIAYAGSNPDAIKLQVRGGSNVVDIPVLELSGWYEMDDTARRDAIRTYVTALQAHVSQYGTNLTLNIRNTTDISTPSVLLSLPADRILAGVQGVGSDTEAMVEVLYQDVLAWEETLFVANKVQGIIASDATLDTYRYPMQTRQNIRYMRMFAGAFMYAAGNHVGIGYGSASGMVQGRPTSHQNPMLFGWGIAHEIGHNMDKLGKAEITNNIYSLAVQAWDGGAMTKSTRLTASNKWKGVYDKVSVGRPGAAGDVFVQLGMYWQLHLAYDGADEPLAFYNQFFKLWKKGEYNGKSYDDRVALIAAKVANRDLTEFFTRWGMTLSEETRTALSAYPAEPRAVWYLNDNSRNERLAGKTGGTGAPSVTASVAENTVTLTITNTDSGAILGYEVRRNGKAIGFTTTGTYTDNLGAANNLTYTYSIVPVDTLGNMGTEVVADEVRIAYDTAIDASLYEVSTEGTATVFTMKDGAAVSVTGIKTGTGSVESCTVQVKTKGSAEWTDVNLNVPAGQESAAYFTKPGTDGTDTRIWTYDVTAVKVEGVPDGAAVTLLDYPGDRVDFYTDATVGTLSAPYKYTDAENVEHTIPAGTLVILGTYRGDPVYNTVEVQARYDLSNEVATENKDPEVDQTKLTAERPMNGYALLFAEIPADGEVSDTSDGFFLFVPDWEAEQKLNAESGWKQPQFVDPETGELAEGSAMLYPTDIRAVLYRTDNPDGSENPDKDTSRRVTSETLWISFPAEGTFPQVQLTGN